MNRKCPGRSPRRLLAALFVLTALLALPTEGLAAGPWIGVSGNKLVNGRGESVRLLGVNRPGAEYQCLSGAAIIEGPTDRSSIETIRSWHVNAVRLPINETCWLGINGVPEATGGSAYRSAIRGYVKRLESAGLYVILDLQWAAPGGLKATGLVPMPDADHAPEFWRSVATEYRRDRSVLFDLFNEPRPGVTWECWELGCEVESPLTGPYLAVGMSELVAVVRATGARQPIMLPGIEWARELRGWSGHLPEDPADALVASNHTYDFNTCGGGCRKILTRISRHNPVVSGEIGEIDCSDQYIAPYMHWADNHNISYLAWAWNAGPEWGCEDGPSLITDFSGTPTPYGAGFKRHLRELAEAAKSGSRKLRAGP